MSDFTIQFGCLVAYRGKDTHIVIPDNVTTIGRRAFYLSNVTNVILPETVAEIEREAFLNSNLQHIEIGKGIKKIGAQAFCCASNVMCTLYPRVPISVFAKSDRRTVFNHFVRNAINMEYDPDVYKKNLAYLRNHLFDDVEYRSKCIDALEKDPELLNRVLSSGKIPSKDLDALISKFVDEQKPDIVALILQY